MAQNKNTPPKKVVAKALPLEKSTFDNKYLLLGIALIVTFICFSNAIRNDFTNWDDVDYVTENSLIKSLSWNSIKTIFTTRSVMGNYHPLAVLSLAVDYHFHNLEPNGFHLTSILIHLCNVALVFFFVQLLVKKPLIAFITALLFGIHPMHVESVAWVAERKDLLYVFFYMASLIAYIYYLKEDKRKIMFFILSFLLFAFSILSKAQAVTLPVILLLIDYFRNRKFDRNAILEKIPFFLLALVMGRVAVMAQKETGAIKDVPNNPLFERILFAGYSFLDYILKLIYPSSLTAYYPYPEKPFPIVYYVAPFIAIALVVLVIKNYKNKPIVFGSGFYIVNIFLLLQLLPVGGAMMAERYSYLCSFGLFFIAGKGLSDFWGNKKMAAYKYPVMAIMIGYGGYLCHETYQRNKVWNSSRLLWENVIKQYKNVPIAYNNLGSYFQKHNQLDTALLNFNEALRLKAQFPEALTNRSDIWRVKGNYVQAIADCDSAIATDKNCTEAYMNRGIAYCFVNRFDDALCDFTFVVKRKGGQASLYTNRGNLYDMKGKIDSALADYSMAVQLDPENADAYFSLGRTDYKLKKYKDAVENLTRAIELHTTANNVYIFRSQCYKEMGNNKAALQDAMTAKNLGLQINEDYISDLKQHIAAGK